MSNKRAAKVAERKDRQERKKRAAETRAISRSRSLCETVGPGRLRGYFWAANRRPSTWHHLYARHFDQRSAFTTRVGAVMPERADSHEDDVINIATVETAYATFYRVHGRAHFRYGAAFPANWRPWPEKVTRAERFSPPGSVGWYLGLTAAAAFDEAAYYEGQTTSTATTTVGGAMVLTMA